MPNLNIVLLVACSLLISAVASTRYEPNWESLDSRPLPKWYDEAKIGIFIHWGVFSVPAFGSEWFWWYWQGQKSQKYVDFMKENYRPDFTYADFASSFTAEYYNPHDWVDLFQSSGAKYIVLTSKHHEGYCNFKTKHSFSWNSMDVGPNRDLVGELATAVKNSSIHLGLYHSMYEWFNPLYLQDKKNGFKTQYFVANKVMPELYELVNQYNPELIWSDGDWEAPVSYWNSTEFLAWLYNESPVKDTVVVNDRWGQGCYCKHGGYWNCADRYHPGTLLKHKWEDAETIDKTSWGYVRNADLSNMLTIDEIINRMVTTVSNGGNFLLNVGPRPDGKIPIIFQERLQQMGKWLAVNGEAIYATKPWTHQNDTVHNNTWYTSKVNAKNSTDVYGIIMKSPKAGALHLGVPTPTANTVVTLLGFNGTPLKWSKGQKGGIDILIPDVNMDDMPFTWAWTLKFTNLVQQ